MRQRFRFNFVVIIAGLSLGMASALFAQQANKSGQRQAPPATNRQAPAKAPAGAENAPKQKPKAEADAVQEEDPKLNAHMKKWEVESAKIKSLHGDQTRTEINRVWSVEKVSKGPFFLEMPDKGRIDMLSVKIPKGKVSSLENSEGKPFELTTGTSERWICTGDAIMTLNEDQKTYEKIEIPKEQQGKNIVNSPLPFLFGMKAAEAKDRFDLILREETKEFVKIVAKPKKPMDQQNYKAAQIKLNKKNYLPEEVRLIDPSGLEIVYRFEGVVINDRDIRGRLGDLFGMKGDPYNPNLKGYTAVLPPDPIELREQREAKQAKDLDPQGNRKSQTKQTSGEMPAERVAPVKPKASAQRPGPVRN